MATQIHHSQKSHLETTSGSATGDSTGLRSYYISKIQDLTFKKEEKQRNWERLRAQRNELNMRGIKPNLIFNLIYELLYH